MSDSPFTRLQNLTRKPESGISALRLLNPMLGRRNLSWPSASVSFRTSAWSQDFCLHPFSYSLSFSMKSLP
jgi:hypothetical protein